MPDAILHFFEKVNGMEKEIRKHRVAPEQKYIDIICNEMEKEVKWLLKEKPDAEYYMKDADGKVLRDYGYLKKGK